MGIDRDTLHRSGECDPAQAEALRAALPTKASVRLLVCGANAGDVRSQVSGLATASEVPLVVTLLPGAPPELRRAVRALLQAGAVDCLAVAPGADGLAATVAALAARERRVAEINVALDEALARHGCIGAAPAWRAALRDLVEAALHSDAPIALTGESGTGKELAARLVHEAQRRRRPAGPLVIVDCTTIQPELSRSELFGHERGAFTTAITARDGAFAQAHGGTLLLDELGELPLALQAELLRAIQEGMYKRVGGTTWKQADFRLVTATHRDLAAERERGTFRFDLYHRIAGTTIRLPPLRERREDVPRLVEHFVRQRWPEDPPDVDDALMDHLVRRDWPGNVRELRQLVARACARHPGAGALTLGALPREELLEDPPAGERMVQGLDDAVARALERGDDLDSIREAAVDAAYRLALRRCGEDSARTAASLRVSIRAVQLHKARQAATVAPSTDR